MKTLFTLFFPILILTSVSFSQTHSSSPTPAPLTGQERDFLKPPIDKDFVASSRIKQVVISDVSATKRPTGDEELLNFDDEGRLAGIVTIEKRDTSKVHAFNYSSNGNLFKETHENRRWRQCVRRSYRLNRDETFLQGKSYEMQGDDAVMLLDTRRYQYEDGKIAKILVLSGGKVTKTHTFAYDDLRRLSQERTEKEGGGLIYTVDYTYNEASQLTEVKRVDHMRGKRSEVFQYVYDAEGRLAETKWLQNAKLKTNFKYVYDEESKLSEIRYETQQGMRRIRGRQLVDYQAYSQEELDALLRAREAQEAKNKAKLADAKR
ncbi:MAG: hypothetical protein AB8F95_17480 [Bacteroidia bacterium]